VDPAAAPAGSLVEPRHPGRDGEATSRTTDGPSRGSGSSRSLADTLCRHLPSSIRERRECGRGRRDPRRASRRELARCGGAASSVATPNDTSIHPRGGSRHVAGTCAWVAGDAVSAGCGWPRQSRCLSSGEASQDHGACGVAICLQVTSAGGEIAEVDGRLRVAEGVRAFPGTRLWNRVRASDLAGSDGSAARLREHTAR
jgi:hypothetical protein